MVGCVQIWKRHVLSLFFTVFSIFIPGWKGCHSNHKERLSSSQVYCSFHSSTVWSLGCCKLHYRIKKVPVFQTFSYAPLSPSVLITSNKEKNPSFSLVLRGKFVSSFLLAVFSPYDKPSYYFQSKILVIKISSVHICLQYWFAKHFGEHWMWKIEQ